MSTVLVDTFVKWIKLTMCSYITWSTGKKQMKFTWRARKDYLSQERNFKTKAKPKFARIKATECSVIGLLNTENVANFNTHLNKSEQSITIIWCYNKR